jgi:hypothetical protein
MPTPLSREMALAVWLPTLFLCAIGSPENDALDADVGVDVVAHFAQVAERPRQAPANPEFFGCITYVTCTPVRGVYACDRQHRAPLVARTVLDTRAAG